MEDDTRSIWDRGNAAFRRDWVWRGTPTGKRPKNSFGTGSQALMPGQDRQVSVLGGQSLAVSKYSRHPSESAELIRFLTSREMQLKLSRKRNPCYLGSGSSTKTQRILTRVLNSRALEGGADWPEVFPGLRQFAANTTRKCREHTIRRFIPRWRARSALKRPWQTCRRS